MPPLPHIEEWMRGRFVANSPACLKRMAEQLLSELDRTDELAAVDVPALVAYGETDDAWPPTTQADMAARLGAATAVITGTGHSPAADRPEATAAALLEFWAKVDAG